MNWMEYLNARMEFIKSELKQGKPVGEIYNSLSVTPMQVVLLCMTAQQEIDNDL